MRSFEFLTEAIDINDPRQVNDRINLYQKIIDQSHFDGEKKNAKTLMDRLINQAKAAGTYKPSASSTSSGERTSTKSSNSSADVNAQAKRKAESLLKYAIERESSILKETSREELKRYFNSFYSLGNVGVNAKGAEMFADLVLARQTKENPKTSLKTALSKLANIPESEIIRVEKVGNVIFTIMLNMENTGYIFAKWVGKDFQRPFEHTGSKAECEAKFEEAKKKAQKTQDGFEKGSEKTNNAGAFKIVFVGHFQDDTSDKIWGWGVKGDTIYQFWGRRGGSPSLKVLEKNDANLAAIDKLAKSKEAKGYRKTSASTFEEMIRKVLDTDPKFSDK